MFNDWALHCSVQRSPNVTFQEPYHTYSREGFYVVRAGWCTFAGNKSLLRDSPISATPRELRVIKKIPLTIEPQPI